MECLEKKEKESEKVGASGGEEDTKTGDWDKGDSTENGLKKGGLGQNEKGGLS